MMDAVKLAFSKADPCALATAIGNFASGHPGDWLSRILLLDDALTHPQDSKAQAQVKLLLQTCAAGEEQGWDVPMVLKVAGLATVFGSLEKSFRSARKRLKKTSFSQDPLDHQIHRLCALLESQWRLAKREQLQQSLDGQGRADTTSWLNTDQLSDTGARLSRIDVFEGMLDAIELIVRFGQFMRRPYSPREGLVRSPYWDPELEVVLRLAVAWQSYEHAWERYKFEGWGHRVVPLDENNDETALLLYPPSPETFRSAECGRIRDAQWQLEFAHNTNEFLGGVRSRKTPEWKQLVLSIRTPEIGTVWDVDLDQTSLNAMTSLRVEEDRIRLWVDIQHYTQTAERTRFSSGESAVTWDEWLRVRSVLEIVSHALGEAAERDLPEMDGETCLRQVVIISREALARAIAPACHMEPSRSLEVLKQLTLQRERRRLDIYAQPLLPMDDLDLVLLSPSIVRAGRPDRAIECALAEFGDDATLLRGTGFELVVADHFAELPGVQVETNIHFLASDGKEVEFDVVILWEGTLVLIEAKFIRGVYSPAAMARAEVAVQQALSQLERREALIATDWAEFRQSARRLSLPASPPPRVERLVVTTTTETTRQREQTPVVDERCLARFFAEPTIDLIEATPDGSKKRRAELARLWRGERPTLAEFLRYVRSPPQVEATSRRLYMEPSFLPIVEAEDPKLFLTSIQVSPPGDDYGFRPSSR